MDLTTKIGRQTAIDKLNKGFADQLHMKFPEFNANLYISLDESYVCIGLAAITDDDLGVECVWGSSLTVAPGNVGVSGKAVSPWISIPSSGSFGPKDAASYWKTIHASIILKNWHEFIGLVDEYCTKYRNLCDKILEANE